MTTMTMTATRTTILTEETIPLVLRLSNSTAEVVVQTPSPVENPPLTLGERVYAIVEEMQHSLLFSLQQQKEIREWTTRYPLESFFFSAEESEEGNEEALSQALYFLHAIVDSAMSSESDDAKATLLARLDARITTLVAGGEELFAAYRVFDEEERSMAETFKVVDKLFQEKYALLSQSASGIDAAINAHFEAGKSKLCEANSARKEISLDMHRQLQASAKEVESLANNLATLALQAEQSSHAIDEEKGALQQQLQHLRQTLSKK